MRITDIFIKRPVLSIVVSLLILLIGLRAAMVLPIRQYPKLSNTVVNITTSYPGASADLINGFITTPIEQAVASAEGVDYMTSSSVLGTSTIQVYIKLNFDPNQALTEVLAKVNSVKYLIPKESNDPIVTKTTGQTTAVMYIGFSSDKLTGSAISDYLTRVVQPVMSTVDGVASADILGGQTFAMRLWLDPVKMAGRGISPGDVQAAIQANNFQAAAGQAKGYFIVSNVTTNTDLQNVNQFKRMIVKSVNGGFVRMEDIATVELAAQSTDASVAFNGEHAIFIGVQATPQGNPLTIVKGIRALFPELERNLPPSMKMKVAFDSTKFIQSSIDEVEKTLGEAVIIVVVVIFLFLASFRSVIIPVITIPLSLIGVCTLMLLAGFSFNLLTLLAMVLAIGLVVDDAIVVVENIHRHLEEGMPPVQAALKGAGEIVGPVISMTITLAAVYAPIGFLGGLTGSLFREFAFTLAGSVIVSGVIALTLSPMMCSAFLKSADEGRFARLVNRVFGAMTRWYGRRLDRSLDYRPVTILFALTILGLVGFLWMHTSKELAPEEDQGIVFSVIKGPKYANIDYLDYYGEKLDKVFSSFPETDLRFALNGINGPQNGIAGMLLKPWDERKRSSIKLKPLVQAELSKIEGVQAFAFNLPPLPGGPGGLPVQMVINSTAGFQAVYEQMEKIKDAARKSGMFIVSDSDLAFNQPTVKVTIDRTKASDLGITMASIGNTLSTLLGGNYVNRFNLEGRSYQVIPQVPRGIRLSPESLGGYYVPTNTGQQVPLSTVVSIQTRTDPNALTHYNQLNSATFQAVPMPGVTVGQAVDFLEREAKKMPTGFSHDYLADSRQYVQEGNQLVITLGFAIV
ncbi:MAG: efflux RND transporter permease subunit, partial [Bradyrhizobium sp.]|nr:efflux RND transporter permease subunit [Bradyrhizobium sp.]